MTEAAVQGGQIQGSVAQAPPVAFVTVALPLGSGQDEPIEVVQQAVRGDEDVLHPHAVQVAQIMLQRQTEHRQFRHCGI